MLLPPKTVRTKESTAQVISKQKMTQYQASCRLLLITILFAATSPSFSWTAPINSNINFRRYEPSYLPSSNENLLKTPSTRLFSSSVNNIEITESDSSKSAHLRIGKRVGSGAYGTVHIAHLIDDDGNVENEMKYIAKRAWTLSELELNVPSAVMELESSQNNIRTGVAQATGVAQIKSDGDEDNNDSGNDADKLKERAERCRYYWNVERHMFQKLSLSSSDNSVGEEEYLDVKVTPQFKGVYSSSAADDYEEEIVPGYGKIDIINKQGGGFFSMGSDDGDEEEKQHEWMVFEYISSSDDEAGSSPAMTLLDTMEMDWKDQHLDQEQKHHLQDTADAMNLPSNEFGDTLDSIFVSILEDLTVIHASNLCHRDVKPGNLLCDGENNRLLLIDFGSAADLDPSSPTSKQQNNAAGNIFSNAVAGLQQQQKRRVGFDEGIAAISPIYSAPETFIKLDENPLTFDVFSAALVICQLLFNLLDERTDAGFTQQLREADYNLDTWLENSLRAKLRPVGFDHALEYLGERRGLWALMKQMLQPDPLNRISSSMALKYLNGILALKRGEADWSDETIARVAQEESYFESVIDSFERCSVSYGDGLDDSRPRPLHFLASFRAGFPAGLVLAEASDNDDDISDMSDEAKEKWKEATKYAYPGEVFVKGWNTNGQADKLGIFEVGDRLRGVGELPFTNAGFESAVDLIERQPRTGGILKLHFDRLPKITDSSSSFEESSSDGAVRRRVVNQGTWKSKGRRGNQEDSFVLYEIKNDVLDDVLLAGVFDGHAGTAASESVSKILPSLFRAELLTSNGQDVSVIKDALEKSWRKTCDLYRTGCDENGECVVDYDPVEGTLFAETGSADLIAGTTATIAAISMNPSGTDELTILNCGDSKTMLVGEPISGSGSVVVFETRDHSPDDIVEIERLSRGQELGLDYSIPECSMSGSYLRVGDFQYALCRSLEGSYVTSKGIVSDPDVTNIDLSTALDGRQYNSLVLACDGLLEVMSSEEVGRECVLMRKAGYKADEVAKNLCGQALKKGSYDNISVIVVHLDDV